MSSTKCKVTSLIDNLTCTIHVTEVKKCMEDGESLAVTLGPTGILVDFDFGSRKAKWLSLFIHTPPNQTYVFHSLDVIIKNGPLQLSTRSFSTLPTVVEGAIGRGWVESLSFAKLSNVEELHVEFRARFERKEETSMPLKPCSDPSLHNDFLGLLQDDDKSDVVLVLGKSKIHVHKAILMKRSEYFRAMFSSGLKESDAKEVKIEADEKLFRILLEFWYSGKHPENIHSIAWSLLEVAHCFQVQSIVDQCEFEIRGRLNVDKVIDALLIAKRLGLPKLKKACFDFIAKNQKAVRDTKKFVELKKDSELMFEVLDACCAASGE